jgi:hypothetical protein
MPDQTRAQLTEEIERLRRQLEKQARRIARLERISVDGPCPSKAGGLRLGPAPSLRTSTDSPEGLLELAAELLGFDGFLVVLDSARRIRFLGGNYHRWWQRKSILLAGGDWLEWIVPEDRERMEAYHQSVHEDGPAPSITVRLRFPTGKTEPFTVVGRPNDGRIWYAARPGTTGRPEPASEEIRRWAGIFAHEMNQPLAAVLTTAQACLSLTETEQAEPGEITEALAALVRRTSYTSDVVRRLREWATNTPVRRERVDLNAVVRSSVEQLQAPLDALGVAVQFDRKAELPAVWGDPVQLQQVTVNLVRNALEAMQHVAPTERRLILRTFAESGEAVVAVEDQGVGLSVAMVERLFTPLVSTKPQGMGLGLAISRRLVEAHGGRLWVKPNVPHGCIFFYSLPGDVTES